MQTNFSSESLLDSANAVSEQILRKCVHCGFCTATCPTYLLLGDELDSPRGRIYLIKDMLENDRPADARTVRHVDRCLSCLSCMTTCPSGVHYMHLVDHARAHIEQTYKRPLFERLLRQMLAIIVPRPGLFRLSLLAASTARPIQALFPQQMKAMINMAPQSLPKPSGMDRPQVFPAKGERKMRVALLTGCAQQVLDTAINEATIRVLTRHNVEVVVAKGSGCCGSLTHHMGKEAAAHQAAAENIRAWMTEVHGVGLDHVVVNASGCGTTMKDYGFMFRDDDELAKDAQTISAMTCDISEILDQLDLHPVEDIPPMRVAYHSACSLQHGQQITLEPLELLKSVGFDATTIPESHICCGSAGTYNLLQPELATQLRDRKLAHINRVRPDVIASGNIGCLMQLRNGTDTPIVHTAELIDWATGGPRPVSLQP